MSQPTPIQELVAKDLHGIEWHFKHIFTGPDVIRQGWRKGTNAHQEGCGTGAVLPELGIYLTASVYRPVLQFSDKVASMLPQKFSQTGNDGLLSFMEKFVKHHFLPIILVDYRKSIQQAISSESHEPDRHA